MVWIRKQYGVLSYVMMLIHYLTMIPIVYIWRFSINLLHKNTPNVGYTTQHIFRKKVIVLVSYFWKTLNYKRHFFKIKPKENIDKLYADETY